jgi:prephenate dehydrogenase
MDEPGFFADTRIAIFGLGLMGGSLALGMRGRCKAILAVDPDPDTRQLAIGEQIVDQISADPAEIIPQADLIILAAPVNVILDFIPRLTGLHSGSPVVLDFGSTKTQICKALDQLPERFEPIGGHPMCGKAVGGLAHAEASIFTGSPFAFTPLARTTKRAIEAAEQLALALGSNPLWVGPHTHDSWVAATSHLPYLLAAALALSTETEASHLIGSGFRSTSRLAGSPSSVMLPILETNRDNVLQTIIRFREQLDDLEAALYRQDFASLRTALDRAADRKALLTGE